MKGLINECYALQLYNYEIKWKEEAGIADMVTV